VGLDPISAGVSTVGNVVSGGKNAGAQNNATNEAAAQQAQTMQIINQYLGSVSPTVSSMVQGLLSGSNPISQAITSAIGSLTGASGTAANYGSTAANYGNSASNQAVAGFGTGTENTALSNFNGLQPEELNALTTNAANSGLSDIATAESQGAFGANSNAAVMNALEKNQQASESAAVNVGAAASSAELGAQEAAASNALGGLESANSTGLSGLSTGISGLGTSISGYGTAAGAGNAQLNATNSGITGAENLLNPNSAGANTLTQLSGQNTNAAAAYGNPYAPAVNSAAQTVSALGTGGKNSSTPSTTNFNKTVSPLVTGSGLTTQMPAGTPSDIFG